MGNFDVADSHHLLVLSDYDSNVYLSGRNVKKATIKKAADLNVYEILKANKIFLAESALDQIKEQYK